MALAAMLIYGGWAVFANQAHGLGAAIRAGVTQAGISFASTFSITALMEALHRTSGSARARSLRAASGAIAMAFALTLGVHWWMTTPEILKTSVPSLVIGTLYCILCSWRLGAAQT